MVTGAEVGPFLGAAATLGTALYNNEKGFSARHEQNYDSQVAVTQRLVEGFAKAYRGGEVDDEDHETSVQLTDEAIEAAKDYSKDIVDYKRVPTYNIRSKVKKKKQVRTSKQKLRKVNEKLHSHYCSSMSSGGSDVSSVAARSGSPPGSGLESERIQDWTYDVRSSQSSDDEHSSEDKAFQRKSSALSEPDFQSDRHPGNSPPSPNASCYANRLVKQAKRECNEVLKQCIAKFLGFKDQREEFRGHDGDLDDIIAIATDVCELSLAQLTAPAKCLVPIIQHLQVIGKVWGDHPDRLGRHWYVETLLSVASLNRTVEWWEAEVQSRKPDGGALQSLITQTSEPSTNNSLSPHHGRPPPLLRTPTLYDFEVVKPISLAARGSIFLAKMKAIGDYYAIKVVKKNDMMAKNQITKVMADRTIYVAKLCFTFQRADNLYLVMEYLDGGDCAALIELLGSLPEEWTKSYLAEVVLALEYLHQRGIVHRDVRPDNLLIDCRGHVKLTDFGLSRFGMLGRQLWDGGLPLMILATLPQRLEGSPDYLAPEVILGLSSDSVIDWWALGIIAFEFLHGTPPFHARTPKRILENILLGRIEWREGYSMGVTNFMKSLLTPDPNERLGYGGAEEVKAHPIFAELDWDKVTTSEAAFKLYHSSDWSPLTKRINEGKPLDGARLADVNKPLPLPPMLDRTSANADCQEMRRFSSSYDLPSQTPKGLPHPPMASSLSYASGSVASREGVGDSTQISPRQRSQILERLESRVPSQSSSFSRNAVYIEDIMAKIKQLLPLPEEEKRVVEDVEDVVEVGE